MPGGLNRRKYPDFSIKRRDGARKVVSDAIDSIPMELFTTHDMHNYLRSFTHFYRRSISLSMVSRMLGEFVAKGEIKCVGKINRNIPLHGGSNRMNVYVRTRDYPCTFTEESYAFLYSENLLMHPQDQKMFDKHASS